MCEVIFRNIISIECKIANLSCILVWGVQLVFTNCEHSIEWSSEYIGRIIKIMIRRIFWNRASRWFWVSTMFALVEFGVIPQRITGFYCNDLSLLYTYRGDTISGKRLLLVAILLPLIGMILLEALQSFNNIQKNSSKLFMVLGWYEEYGFSALVNIVMVDILKVLVGELRPHFFDVCKPDAECKGNEFVPTYRCTNTIYSETEIVDCARSFPSGHTSVAIHTAGFLVWYLHKRSQHIRGTWYHLISPTQVVLVLSAVFCGISRIADRRHHWWDVLGGALIGAGSLVYMIRSLPSSDIIVPVRIMKRG